MKYFSEDFTKFFKGLSKNNHKEWFDQNRSTYENAIKKPFYNFVEEMILRVREDDPSVLITPKDAIFRINRDIRFSKDKTPYKTQVSAIVSPGGRKDHTTPGIYFEIGADNLRLYGGLYMLEKEQLYRVRSYIAANLKQFDKLINDKKFKKFYGGAIHGEKNKVIPKEFQEVAKKQPLLYNKGFYYFAKLDPKLITDPKLADKMMEGYHIAKPLKVFLSKALEN